MTFPDPTAGAAIIFPHPRAYRSAVERAGSGGAKGDPGGTVCIRRCALAHQRGHGLRIALECGPVVAPPPQRGPRRSGPRCEGAHWQWAPAFPVSPPYTAGRAGRCSASSCWRWEPPLPHPSPRRETGVSSRPCPGGAGRCGGSHGPAGAAGSGKRLGSMVAAGPMPGRPGGTGAWQRGAGGALGHRQPAHRSPYRPAGDGGGMRGAGRSHSS